MIFHQISATQEVIQIDLINKACDNELTFSKTDGVPKCIVRVTSVVPSLQNTDASMSVQSTNKHFSVF